MIFSFFFLNQHLRDQSSDSIFNSANGQKVPIKMMRAQGYFKTGNIEKYNSEAIEFPYEVRFDFSNFYFKFSLKFLTFV